jgi:hypothetical protein
MGTSAGVILRITQDSARSTPMVTGELRRFNYNWNVFLTIHILYPGIPQGHTGHVRFLTSVEINESVNANVGGDGATAVERNTKSDASKNSNHMLIISGGDGFEDFRTSGTNTMNEVAGREDSTNHLLLWQQA